VGTVYGHADQMLVRQELNLRKQRSFGVTIIAVDSYSKPRGVNLVGNWGGRYDRLLSGPNFLLAAKLAVLKHLTQ